MALALAKSRQDLDLEQIGAAMGEAAAGQTPTNRRHETRASRSLPNKSCTARRAVAAAEPRAADHHDVAGALGPLILGRCYHMRDQALASQ